MAAKFEVRSGTQSLGFSENHVYECPLCHDRVKDAGYVNILKHFMGKHSSKGLNAISFHPVKEPTGE